MSARRAQSRPSRLRFVLIVAVGPVIPRRSYLEHRSGFTLTNRISSGTPKKARWSTAKKIDAKTGPKKAHRGQTQVPRGRDDRAPRTYGNDRPARSGDTRDDRAPRAYGSDRPARSNGARDDRPPRTSDRRDARAPRTYGSERPARSGDTRDDRAPRTYGSDRPARRSE